MTPVALHRLMGFHQREISRGVVKGNFPPGVDGMACAASGNVAVRARNFYSGRKLTRMWILMAAGALLGRIAINDVRRTRLPSNTLVTLAAGHTRMRPIESEPRARMIEQHQFLPGVHRMARLASLQCSVGRMSGHLYGELTAVRARMAHSAGSVLEPELDRLRSRLMALGAIGLHVAA
jgi:hypothetical protein